MFSKESLYINAIKYKTQLKISYKKLQNEDIVEANNSVFIAKDEILARDVASKLVAHSEEINDTYISTLLLQDDTKLYRKNEKINIKENTVTLLNSDYYIAISKSLLFETKNYFEKCGVDYVFSAFHILNLHIEQNPCNNSLVILLFNNQAFCMVVDSKSEIVFHKRLELTPFEDIQSSKFYENEVLGQKLFDEVYSLEVYEAVKNTIEEFYTISKDTFIEKISLLYNVKQIPEDQIQSMSEDFMIDVTYHPISVDEELFELSKDKHSKKSFLKPRVKPKPSIFRWLAPLLAIFAIIAVGYLFIPIDELFNKKEPVKQTQVKRVVKLPNHQEKNNIIENRVLKSLELIPYDVVLKELYIESNSLKMSVDMLNKDTFIKVLEPKLLNDYKLTNFEIKEENKEKAVIDAVIEAEGLKNKKQTTFKEYSDVYEANEFMPIITVTEQIKMLFPKDAIVTFKSNFKSEVITFNYLINVVVKNPIKFFEIIDGLNNELYSVNITYPISFVKTEAGIEIEFILQFHQPK
ncbi:MAG: hypothetical protein ACNI25_00180 [Halarcobacter sp.]